MENCVATCRVTLTGTFLWQRAQGHQHPLPASAPVGVQDVAKELRRGTCQRRLCAEAEPAKPTHPSLPVPRLLGTVSRNTQRTAWRNQKSHPHEPREHLGKKTIRYKDILLNKMAVFHYSF